ncbi:MAG TPA: hypothetical protein VHC18_24320, partial [Amycolatopsis sp.]|nr:hypothetical protein [Amycolatopsis sp.]
RVVRLAVTVLPGAPVERLAVMALPEARVERLWAMVLPGAQLAAREPRADSRRQAVLMSTAPSRQPVVLRERMGQRPRAAWTRARRVATPRAPSRRHLRTRARTPSRRGLRPGVPVASRRVCRWGRRGP